MRYFRAISDFSRSVYPAKSTTSIRSSSGPGMFWMKLAVAMKSTSLRSNGTPR